MVFTEENLQWPYQYKCKPTRDLPLLPLFSLSLSDSPHSCCLLFLSPNSQFNLICPFISSSPPEQPLPKKTIAQGLWGALHIPLYPPYHIISPVSPPGNLHASFSPTQPFTNLFFNNHPFSAICTIYLLHLYPTLLHSRNQSSSHYWWP